MFDRCLTQFLYKILFLSVLFPLSTLLAQDTIAKNVIYLEGGGVGGLYSYNYERMINKDISIRIGYSSWKWRMFGLASVKCIPLIINFLQGDGNGKTELGIGIEYVEVGPDPYSTNIFVVGTICYRYQPNDGGFHFRIGFVPMFGFGRNQIGITFGVSTGYCF
jgi:hypothetical protein